jgi:prevent-host-death family protein
MRSVGLKALKNKLSEYVRLAAGGETVLVTDRSRVVAELVPPQQGRNAQMTDAFLAQGMREGWLTPAKIRAGKAPPRKPNAPLDELLDELRRDREGR